MTPTKYPNQYEYALIQALKHALTQVRSRTEKRLVAQEFWHSLNRKGLIPNEKVELLITYTLLE
jgi:hypothetical protein